MSDSLNSAGCPEMESPNLESTRQSCSSPEEGTSAGKRYLPYSDDEDEFRRIRCRTLHRPKCTIFHGIDSLSRYPMYNLYDTLPPRNLEGGNRERNDSNDASSSSLSLYSIDGDPDLFDVFDYNDPLLLTKLFAACRNNDMKTIKVWVSQGKDLNMIDNKGNTALHYCVVHESFEALVYLLGQPNIRKDAKNFEEFTPLHLAFLNGLYDISVELILRGLDLSIQAWNIDTPMVYLFSHSKFTYEQKKELLNVIIKERGLKNDDGVEIMKSIICVTDCNDEDMEILNMFLYLGIDVNKPVNDISVVIQSLNCGCFTVFNMLLDFIYDFNARAPVGSIFLSALLMRYPFPFEMIERGADVNVSEGSVSTLRLSTYQEDAKLFYYIWDRVNLKKVFSQKPEFLKSFVLECKFSVEQFYDALYMMVGSEYGPYLLRNAVHRNKFYSGLLDKLKEYSVPREDCVKTMSHIVQYYNTVEYVDILNIYFNYHFDVEFEVFLNANVYIRNFKKTRTRFSEICCPQNNYSHTGNVLSLQELSMRVFRTLFIKSPKPGEKPQYFGYYKKVQSLQLPKLIEEYVLLKRDSL